MELEKHFLILKRRKKKKIFSTPTGIRTHTKKILVSPTARARPLPAAAAHVDMRSETRDECILPHHRKITDEAFFGSRKDASVWQREKLIFHRFIHRFPPPTLGFTNKTMTAKISAKKVGDFYL